MRGACHHVIMRGVCHHMHEWLVITVRLVCDLYMLTSSGHLCSEIFTGLGVLSFFLT